MEEQKKEKDVLVELTQLETSSGAILVLLLGIVGLIMWAFLASQDTSVSISIIGFFFFVIGVPLLIYNIMELCVLKRVNKIQQEKIIRLETDIEELKLNSVTSDEN